MKTWPTKSHGGVKDHQQNAWSGARLIKHKLKMRNSLMRASSKAACSIPPHSVTARLPG